MHSMLNNPQLLDCRRLFLKDYEVWINIGVHDFEKKGEQRVLINVDLYVPLASTTPQHDQLHEAARLVLGARPHEPALLMVLVDEETERRDDREQDEEQQPQPETRPPLSKHRGYCPTRTAAGTSSASVARKVASRMGLPRR